jgi:hypothetical protein
MNMSIGRASIHTFVLRAFVFLLAGNLAGVAFNIYANQEAMPPEWMLGALRFAAYGAITISSMLFFAGFWFRGTQRRAVQAMWWWQVIQMALTLGAFNALSKLLGIHELIRIQSYPSMMFYLSPGFYSFCLWNGFVSVCITALAFYLFCRRAPQWRIPGAQWFSWATCYQALKGLLEHCTVAAVCFGFVGYALLTLAVEGGTSGGLLVKRQGVYSQLVTYRKGDRRVVVVPMIHIGDREFYSLTVDRFATQPGLTLLEGVSGGGKELKKLNHRDIASAVGVSAQSDEMLKGCKPSHLNTQGFLCEGNKMRYEFADLDFKDFKPITREYLNGIGTNGAFGDIAGEMKTMTSPAGFLIGWDIEDNREERLFRDFDEKAAEENLVVIPWGAAHFFRIGQHLQDRGFKPESTELVRVISFGSMLRALVGIAPKPASQAI